MIIDRAVLDQIVGEARAAAPRECCGLLVGSGAVVHSAVAARNLSPTDTRYLLDPADHFRVRREARHRGLEVIGFYHSHPHGAPMPSATDLAEADYPELVWMIVGLEPAAAAKLFRIRAGDAVEVALEIVSAADRATE